MPANPSSPSPAAFEIFERPEPQQRPSRPALRGSEVRIQRTGDASPRPIDDARRPIDGGPIDRPIDDASQRPIDDASRRPINVAAVPLRIVEAPVRPAPVARPVPSALAPQQERELIAILEASPLPGDTIEIAYSRKERALGMLFGQLAVAQARELHRRLVIAASDDALATAFGRLVAIRRTRLLTFLADARRREATSGRRA